MVWRALVALVWLGLGAGVVAQDASDPVFDGSVLQDIHLTMSPVDWRAIQDDPGARVRYPATVRWRDETIPNAGVRAGGYGSLYGPKPKLSIKFGEYGLPNRWRTLRGLVLRNNVQDPAMMSERIHADIARARGLVAQRTASARLFVNDEYIGLYTLVERVDKSFCTRYWNENDGRMYQFKVIPHFYNFEWLGSDWRAYVPSRFELEFDEDNPDHTGLMTLIDTINNAPPPAWETALERICDSESFLNVLSLEAAVAEWDGIMAEGYMNNFFMYQLERDRKFRCIPHGREGGFFYNGNSIWRNWEQNTLLNRMSANDTLRNRYLTKVGEALSRWCNGRFLNPIVSRYYLQIRDAVYADTRKPYSNEDWEAAVAAILAFEASQTPSILGQLAAEVTEREGSVGLGQGGLGQVYTWRTSTQTPPPPSMWQFNWSSYTTAVGETHPAYGDVDGDGLDEIVVGIGPFPSNGGWVAVHDDAEHGSALLGWLRVPNAAYNAANGATFPACGDTDGDGRAEIAVGLGRGGRGLWYVHDDALDGYALRATRQVPWTAYNEGPGGGETRLALGDIDVDGRAEVVVGLGPGGQGKWYTFSDAASGYQFRTENVVQWPDYCANRAGTTRPAVGDIDADGIAEVIIGLEQGGECRLEVFDDAWGGHAHLEWIQVGEEPYRAAVGATRPALADMDADGDADLAVGFARGGGGKVEVWRRRTSLGLYERWYARTVPGPAGYAAANGETWPAFGHRRWSR